MITTQAKYSKLRVAITGGTGSFGQTVARRFLALGAEEIRIVSRDEAKQDAMRGEFKDPRLQFFIADVRQRDSLQHAFDGVDLVFHAAALKQVPSCEFFPEQAVQTNVLGSENVILVAAQQNVKKLVFLSTDKAVQPINAMGMTKALMEKLIQAYARRFQHRGPQLCTVRYGNVLYSRGSVVPLFIDRILKGQELPVTAPKMTRFLLPLEEAVDLVELAYEKGCAGDLFIRKSPAATVETIVAALQSLFNTNLAVKLIGIRHGEKMHETLATGEELRKSEDLQKHFCIPMDGRDLNYGNAKQAATIATDEFPDFTSANALQLDQAGAERILLEIPEIAKLLQKG